MNVNVFCANLEFSKTIFVSSPKKLCFEDVSLFEIAIKKT